MYITSDYVGNLSAVKSGFRVRELPVKMEMGPTSLGTNDT